MDKGIILALIFAVIVGVFALANSERVVIDFIFTHVKISQALVILLSALLGALIIFFIGLIRNLKLKQGKKKLENELKNLEKEIIDLENQYSILLDSIEDTEYEDNVEGSIISEDQLKSTEEDMEDEA